MTPSHPFSQGGVLGSGVRGFVGLHFWVDGLAFVTYVRYVARVVISGVLDCLDPPVRQHHGVGPGDHLGV